MRIVVTGGSGDLGSRVMAQGVARGHAMVSASRRTGVDLGTGTGLAGVLAGADAVVNCADDTRRGDDITVHGARRVAGAAGAAGAHLVHISIVGIDAIPLRYYQRKLAAEHLIADTGVPATVLRATQFHSLAAYFARMLTTGPLTFPIGRMAFQPVDTDWVAGSLLDLATGPGPAAYRRATDVAGPDVLDLEEIARLVRARAGKSAPRVVRLPAVGGTMRAFAERRTVADPSASHTGGRRFVDWLADQQVPLTGR
jgi:uncharacterized protein YbjT (DUF2867 family)